MKTKRSRTLLAVCGALALAAGCGRNDGAAPPAPRQTQTPADATAAQSQKAAEARQKAEAKRAAQDAEAQKQSAAAKAADAAKAAEAAQAEAMKVQAEAAQAVAAQEQGRIQGLMDSAKNLIGQNKYAEALKVLGELANLKLTPDQQALVAGLKQTAEKQAAQAATDKAAAGTSKAIGDALGGKK